QSGHALAGWSSGTGAGTAVPMRIGDVTLARDGDRTLSDAPVVAYSGTKGMIAVRASGGYSTIPFDGTSWGAEAKITDRVATYADAKLAMNSAGHAVLAWRHANNGSDSYGGTVSASIFDGTKWSAAQEVSLTG